MNGFSGPWAACVMWVMAVAVVEQRTGTHTILAGVCGGCNKLGGQVPWPTGGTCEWVSSVVVLAGWVGLTSDPSRSDQVPIMTDWAGQFPVPWVACSSTRERRPGQQTYPQAPWLCVQALAMIGRGGVVLRLLANAQMWAAMAVL